MALKGMEPTPNPQILGGSKKLEGGSFKFVSKGREVVGSRAYFYGTGMGIVWKLKKGKGKERGGEGQGETYPTIWKKIVPAPLHI